MTDNTKNISLHPAPQIWVATLDALRSHRAGLQVLLSAAEQARCQRYVQQDDRDRYLGGRALSKLAVAKMTGLPPAEIAVITAATGKPSVSSSRAEIALPAINISHAGELVVVALQYDAEIGVDVELFNHDVNLDDLMDVVCSKEEIAEINLPAHRTRAQKFYEFWVLKEAYLKATGEGLSADARKLTFSIDAASRVSLTNKLASDLGNNHSHEIDEDSAADWQFVLRQYDDRHLIAFASNKTVDRLTADSEPESALHIPAFMDALLLLREYYSG